MRWLRSLPSQSLTSWPRGANVIYAVIILSFSAASINSSPSSKSTLKEPLNTPPASTTHFSTSQLTISEFTSTSLPLPLTTNASSTASPLHKGVDNTLSSPPVYSNQFVLEIQGGEDAAKSFATTHGFIYLGQVSVIVSHSLMAPLTSPPPPPALSLLPDDELLCGLLINHTTEDFAFIAASPLANIPPATLTLIVTLTLSLCL